MEFYSRQEEKELLSLIVSLKWTDFTQFDWEVFSGCESKTPKLAYDKETGTTYIIDGDKVSIIPEDSFKTNIEYQYQLTTTHL